MGLTFFTNDKKIPNFVQMLIRMHTMNDQDLGKISMLVQNFPEQTPVLLNCILIERKIG